MELKVLQVKCLLMEYLFLLLKILTTLTKRLKQNLTKKCESSTLSHTRNLSMQRMKMVMKKHNKSKK